MYQWLHWAGTSVTQQSTRHEPQVSTFAGKINNPRKGEIYSKKPDKANGRDGSE